MALRAAKGDQAARGEQRGADIPVCRVDTRVDARLVASSTERMSESSAIPKTTFQTESGEFLELGAWLGVVGRRTHSLESRAIKWGDSRRQSRLESRLAAWKAAPQELARLSSSWLALRTLGTPCDHGLNAWLSLRQELPCPTRSPGYETGLVEHHLSPPAERPFP